MKGKIQDESDDYVCRTFWLLGSFEKLRVAVACQMRDKPGFLFRYLNVGLRKMHLHVILEENLSSIL